MGYVTSVKMVYGVCHDGKPGGDNMGYVTSVKMVYGVCHDGKPGVTTYMSPVFKMVYMS